MDDEIFFLDEDDIQSQNLEPWRVLLVDDDENIHKVTTVVLKDFLFENRPLEIMHAYSGQEAIDLLSKDPNFAVAFLDVIMESEDAGFTLAHRIRNELENTMIRLIIRTGAQKLAPKLEIFEKYDIHDYKEKTDLNNISLATTMISALRSYKDIKTIKDNEEHLNQLVEEKTKELQEINTTLQERVESQTQIMLQESKYAEIGKTLSMVSHQWKQPLTTISSILSSTRIKIDLDELDIEKLKTDLVSIEDILVHLSNTVDEFGKFFRSSKLKEDYRLSTLMDETLNIVESIFEKSNIKVIKQYDFDKPIPLLTNELKQVFLNMLTNARDALLDSLQEEPHIKIHIFQEGGYVKVIFEDNGTGINDSIKKTLFDPYTSTKSKNGMGIGLYMSMIIVREHSQGDIEVADASPQGAKFIISLPIEDE